MDIRNTALMKASATGRVAVVLQMANLGANLDLQHKHCGQTTLMMANHCRPAAAVEALVRRGAKLDLQDMY